MTLSASADPAARPSMPAPFAPFEPRWDAPQLSEAELRRRSAFEWWYFDLSTPDGVELVVIFSRRNPWLVTGKSSVYIEYKDGKRKLNRVYNYPPERFQWSASPGRGEITIGPSSLRIVGADAASLHWEIMLDLPTITARLQMTPLHRGFLPTADGSYFRRRDDATRRTSVSFSAPMMRAEGELSVGGVTRKVAGKGYHDHPWGTEQLFWTNREWHWVRAEADGSDVMFAKVWPFDEIEGDLTFLYSGRHGEFEPSVSKELTVNPSAWKKESFKGLAFPHELGAGVPGREWRASFARSLLDTPFYNRSAISWRPNGASAPGEGWIEYWKLNPKLRRLTFLAARARMFFWRPFPLLGKR